MDDNEYEDAYEYYEDDDGWDDEEDHDSMSGWDDWNYGCDYEDF